MIVINIRLFKKRNTTLYRFNLSNGQWSNRELFNTFRGHEIITLHTSHPLKVLKSLIFIQTTKNKFSISPPSGYASEYPKYSDGKI
jgi:hypothetical protein